MTLLDDRYAVAESLSEGWLDAVCAAYAAPGGRLVHLIVRVLRPTVEIEDIRSAAQSLIDEWNAAHTNGRGKRLHSIETTRNTIFPAAWGRRHPEPSDLAAYYRSQYTKGGLRGFGPNQRGTYFGRIVAYPRSDSQEPADQLTDTVRKLRDEIRGGQPKSSRYEINVYNEALDTNPMGFPCLAHLSVHLHDHVLQLQAVYRNESLIERAYGNYLGIAELQAYMAAAAGIGVGELMITVGHAELNGRKSAVKAVLD